MFSHIEIYYSNKKQKYIAKEIGEFGKNRLMPQIPFLDVKAAKTNFQSFLPTNNLNLLLKSEKESLYNKITEYFYTNHYTQQYKNIPLHEWVTAYWCLYEMSRRISKTNMINTNSQLIYFSILEWKNILSCAGISELNIDNIIRKMTFSSQAKDLYAPPP
ncbi:hypothetical protein IAE51_05345 [Lactococcus sp. S64]|uniref:hypothetical protein n=1 Tax=Lactococcus sp. S64 TaxID=2767459 RepID=UPI001903A2B1|nr:hypothetical protein [Lactococcus sp. S64]MBK0083329.1 hypothetical protein [Lactococcus sp. S64]